ncbi:unnamed protein product [Durusdinium trenchii]|uniref:Uncharacterized protein n=1 Tax=Durusdinium trenchii TaxID=1381693 RepID=A0ABP0RMP1_9DINO
MSPQTRRTSRAMARELVSNGRRRGVPMGPLFPACGAFLTLASCWVNLGDGFGTKSRARLSQLDLRLAQLHGITSLSAIAEPPVRTRPPDVTAATAVERSEWTECFIKNPETGNDCVGNLRLETWIFRTTDYGDFQHFLKIRGFQNEGQQASLSCRERQIDPEIKCSECVRLLRGGYYGHLGVSVPAYPPQSDALGCLALSKLIDMPAPSTTEDDSGDWDGDEGRQTAFCNSVNVRMEQVGA